MSLQAAKKLFAFNRSLPEPFDKLSNKRVKVSSKYGDSFLDITDLNKLPVTLANMVKRHIRV